MFKINWRNIRNCFHNTSKRKRSRRLRWQWRSKNIRFKLVKVKIKWSKIKKNLLKKIRLIKNCKIKFKNIRTYLPRKTKITKKPKIAWKSTKTYFLKKSRNTVIYKHNFQRKFRSMTRFKRNWISTWTMLMLEMLKWGRSMTNNKSKSINWTSQSKNISLKSNRKRWN